MKLMSKLKQMKRKILSISCITLILFLMQITTCYAKVITTESTAPSDFIYIAGNPDLYPIEYYDEKEECYKGLIPELLEYISNDTGLSFAYINGNLKNNQKELVKYNQVELVTAFKKEDWTEYGVVDQICLFSPKIDGEETEICIGFTKIAKDEIKNSIKNAILQIPESEKNSALITYFMENPRVNQSNNWIYGLILFCFVVLFAYAVKILIHKHKQKKTSLESMVDDLTGIGNGEYYMYSFNTFIPNQVKDLYYAMIISWKESKEKKKLSSTEIMDVQKYVAQHLNAKTTSTEYLSRIEEGTFILLYQSSNRDAAIHHANEILCSLRKYLSEFNNEYARLFSAGICSLEDNPDCNGEEILYRAKQGYLHAIRNNLPLIFVTKDVIHQNLKNEKLRLSMNKAIDNNEFKLYFQFIVDKNSEQIIGGEVLSRWENPDYGLMMPGQYIEIMKEIDAISKHDYYIFENVCRFLEL